MNAGVLNFLFGLIAIILIYTINYKSLRK
jgi:hypothetical protein